MPQITFRLGKGQSEILTYLSENKEAPYSELKSHLLAKDAYQSKQQVDKGLKILEGKHMIEEKNKVFKLTADGKKLMEIVSIWGSEKEK